MKGMEIMDDCKTLLDKVEECVDEKERDISQVASINSKGNDEAKGEAKSEAKGEARGEAKGEARGEDRCYMLPAANLNSIACKKDVLNVLTGLSDAEKLGEMCKLNNATDRCVTDPAAFEDLQRLHKFYQEMKSRNPDLKNHGKNFMKSVKAFFKANISVNMLEEILKMDQKEKVEMDVFRESIGEIKINRIPPSDKKKDDVIFKAFNRILENDDYRQFWTDLVYTQAFWIYRSGSTTNLTNILKKKREQ